MADALLDEVLKANQIKAEENERLKKYIARIEAEKQALKEHNGILMAKNYQFESVEANKQALEANKQALEAQNHSLCIDLKKATIEIERLQSIIRRNPSMPKPVDSLIEELQSTIAFLTNELDETNFQTMKAMRLLARNLDQAKKESASKKKENDVLQANQEIHMGIISDLKGEILEEKMEKNQMEKDFTTTTETYSEPFVMEFKSISPCHSAVHSSLPSFNPFHETGYLDNYRNTTLC